MKITVVSDDERKARGEPAMLVARLIETGETVLVEGMNAQALYAAGKTQGVTVHISKRETGYVAWVEEAAK